MRLPHSSLTALEGRQWRHLEVPIAAILLSAGRPHRGETRCTVPHRRTTYITLYTGHGYILATRTRDSYWL